MPLDAFHPFPRLPTELRLKIWSESLPLPRVIETIWSITHDQWFCAGESRSPPSPLLVTNREAREVFLEHYTPFCDARFIEREMIARYLPTYIDPAIDTLFIGTNHEEEFGFTMIYPLPVTLQGLIEKFPCVLEVKHIAFEISEWYDKVSGEHETSYEKELEILRLIPNSEVVTILDYDIDENWLGCGTQRPVGEIELVEPTQMDLKNEEEMWPGMLRKFEGMRKAGVKIPKTDLKEVLRGGVLSTFG